MSEVFVWNGNVEQTYGPDYGSQTLSASGENPFSRTKSFNMDAAGERLILQPLLSNDNTWRAFINVLDGALVFDGSAAKAANGGAGTTSLNTWYITSAETNGQNIFIVPKGPSSSSSVEFVNIDHLELGGGKISRGGALRVDFPKEKVVFAQSTWELDGDAVLYINALNTGATVQADEGTAYGEGFLLSGTSTLEIIADNLEKFAELDIVTNDQAHVLIISRTIGIKNPSSAVNSGPFITLNKGNARVALEGIPERGPMDLTGLAKGKRGFNFTGNKDTNKSVLTLDFSFVDAAGSTQSGNSGYGWNWLLQNQLICVKGVPQTDNLTLTYEPTEKGLVIQFRTKAG